MHQVLLILATRRSASTEMAADFASYPCMFSLNEYYSAGRLPQGNYTLLAPFFAKPRAVGVKHSVHQIYNDTDLLCKSHFKGCESCVANVKIHNAHLSNERLSELMHAQYTQIIINERKNLTAQECSLNASLGTQLWHPSSISQEVRLKSWKAMHCSSAASPRFARSHRSWYNLVRSIASKTRKLYLELPFEYFIHNRRLAREVVHNILTYNLAHQ